MQSDQDQAQATPDDAPASLDERRAAVAARWDAAYEKLGGLGKLDVTFAKVGDRVGFFVSVAEGDENDLEIDVKSPLFEGRFNVRRMGYVGRWQLFSPGGRDVLTPEAGISKEGYYHVLTSIAKA